MSVVMCHIEQQSSIAWWRLLLLLFVVFLSQIKTAGSKFSCCCNTTTVIALLQDSSFHLIAIIMMMMMITRLLSSNKTQHAPSASCQLLLSLSASPSFLPCFSSLLYSSPLFLGKSITTHTGTHGERERWRVGVIGPARKIHSTVRFVL